jgi:hypothetical protein
MLVASGFWHWICTAKSCQKPFARRHKRIMEHMRIWKKNHWIITRMCNIINGNTEHLYNLSYHDLVQRIMPSISLVFLQRFRDSLCSNFVCPENPFASGQHCVRYTLTFVEAAWELLHSSSFSQKFAAKAAARMFSGWMKQPENLLINLC